MLAAMGSGSGKTTLACGLLALLKRRGTAAAGFKCGPDYIDPMFHTRVLGVPSRNLDLFLQGADGVRRTLGYAERQGADFALLESAMGFYDGAGGTVSASAWETADLLETPVLLVLRPTGVGLTLAAQVKGMLDFRRPSRIVGLFLNGCKPSLYAYLAPLLERETGLPVLGYLPHMEQAAVESRHLGLLTAQEIQDFSARYELVADQLERTAELDGILALASDAASSAAPLSDCAKSVCTIAVARDEAFCFYYADNLDRLRDCGATLAYFSPLHGEALPESADGLYLGGGYPELYAQALSQNEGMRESIGCAVRRGLPTVAECGGFLYLQRSLEDAGGAPWPMAGVLPGAGIKTGRLQRFGYLYLNAAADSLLFRQGETVPVHEFHYWDTTENGCALEAVKPGGSKKWACCYASPSLYAGFPHLHFGGALPIAERFAAAAAVWHKERI